MSGTRCARLLVLACATALVASMCAASQAGLQAIWAVDDGEKIFRDDITNPLKSSPYNSVWNGAKVSISSARNEIVAFQLILEADAAGAHQVNVVVSDLVNGGDTIRRSHPLPDPNDYVGVGVELFTEHYFDITTPSWDSPCGGLGWSGEAKPGITGKIPDALAPFSAKQGKGGAPFDIGASLNQGVWVDTYVPKGIPAGLYTGTIEVTVAGSPAAEIPLELTVLDFTLSDQNHYQSMVFYARESILERHDLGYCTPEMWAMVLEYHRMAHRHRMELIGCGDWTEVEPLKGTLTGEAFTEGHNYEGPGEGVGNSLFSVNTYGINFQPETEAGYRAESDAWVNWFTDNGLGGLEYFVYLTDEPGPDMYPWVIERAGWIHDNPGPGQNLSVFMTRWPIDTLVGSIDIWCCPPNYYDPTEAAAAQARGERVWLYASYRPNTPADATDEYGIAWRLKPWIAHYRDIPRWFTWESTHYYNNQNEVDPGGRKNVWANPIGFSGDMGGGVPCPADTGNGDGILFYPGQDALFPEEDRDYPGPVSSIRMKMYRRGIQDVEYMVLAAQSGHEADVQTILAGLLTHTMWDCLTVPDWSVHNADYEAARTQFASYVSPDPVFWDVQRDHWALHEIEACYHGGIVGGYEDGSYRPNVAVTRDQMAVYVARALAGGDGTVPPGPGTATFSDVPTDYWAFKYVEYAAANNIVAGYPGGNYEPTWQVDRGQMAVFIARCIVTPHGDEGLIGYTPPATPTFSDVPTDHWAYIYVEYIAQPGVAVTQGYPDGTYRPAEVVNRGQMAVYVQRAFGLPI